MSCDLIGLNTYKDTRQLRSVCVSLLGTDPANVPRFTETISWEGRNVHVGVFPRAIEIARYRTYLQSKAVRAKVAHLLKRFKELMIIVGIDPLESFGGK